MRVKKLDLTGVGDRYLGKVFNYANNPISLAGIVIASVSGLAIATFMLIELSGGFHNSYVGLFAYMILPAVFLVGLVLIPLGMWLRRRKLVIRGVSAAERYEYPRLDFNSPQIRRLATIVLSLTAINALIFSVASFQAVEHMETAEFCGATCHTVMEPEYITYQESPHSRVNCVECHIGPGASYFVKAKVDGLRQMWKMMSDTYERPIETPVHGLRPARETCEKCHWPEKHYADKVHTFARFEEDEANTPSYFAMLLKPGGGARGLGRHGGIHWWHIFSDNKIRFVSDPSREEIYWVELTTPDGEVRVYTREDQEIPPPEELEASARVMDCIDCHNRPTHLMEVPSKALDRMLESRPEWVTLPYFKREAMAAIGSDGYSTHAEGVESVRQNILGFYQRNHPDIWREREQVVESAAAAAARVYARGYFPEMKTSWETHPNHIGHEDSPGCFRCHDEELATEGGEHVITLDCEVCHAFLADGSDTAPDLAAMVGGG